MKIAVVGAGAIGGYLGVRLAHSGEDVTFIARGTNLAAIRADGMKLILEDGSELRAEGSRAFEKMNDAGPQDVVLLTLKAHQVAAVAPDLNQLCHATTSVVTMQNGIPWWYFHKHGGQYEGTPIVSADPDGSIARSIDAARVIGSVVYRGGSRLPGVVQVVEGNRFTLGNWCSTTPRVQTFGELHQGWLQSAVAQTSAARLAQALGNLSSIRSARCARHPDGHLSVPATRDLSAQMMAEAEAIAKKLGVTFRVSIERRIAGAEKVGAHKTSMLQDVEQGRPIEIEALAGSVVELGRLTQTPTPHISAVYACASLLAKALNARHARLTLEG